MISNPPSRSYSDTTEYARDMQFRLHKSFEIVKKSLVLAAQKQESARLKVAKVKDVKVGDLVYCHTPAVKPGICRKLHHSNKGPYKVIKQFSPVNFELQLCSNPAKTVRTHVDHIVLIKGRKPVVQDEPGVVSDVVQPGTSGVGQVPDRGVSYNLRRRNQAGFVTN
ncbi:krab-a domain-containing protein [Lasius niger]|uniref:Krab-a domain-containing protein n=1 Tax=Lasius niger TaxID=67767 RepID=A0A0J7JV15_LASNI|nr:krab-a domain-containing protein [Lasius niger]